MRKVIKNLLILILISVYASCGVVAAYEDDNTNTIYVSAAGSDSNNGKSTSTPLATLSAAFSLIENNAEIVLLDSTTYIEPPAHSSDLSIKGNSSGITLTLPSEISLNGNLTIDNVVLSGASTIYANGYSLVIGSSVTSDSRMNVYGGKKSSAYTGDTDIKLLGGQYTSIYGGGYSAAVTGNTNVVLGGNANPSDSIDDSSDSISPCLVYGGGNNGTVTGKTNVTLQDNAIAKYLVGSGTGTNGTADDTNIYINGGQVMNVYAGSRSVTLPSGAVTHITMTGGKAEALFGGCENVALTGHTYITLLGGEVTRRVYTGCYNATNTLATSFNSDRYVTGTTTLYMGPNAKANTKSGLSAKNQINVGVFAGSRTKAQHDAEQNTIIYLDNSYSACSGYIGEKTWFYTSRFKSFEDYIVKAGTGGDVYGTNTAGTIYIAPDRGNYGIIGSNKYVNKNASISAGTTTVTFADDFNINSVTAAKSDDGITATVNITAENAAGEASPRLIAGVYEADSKRFLSAAVIDASTNTSQIINIPCETIAGKTYEVKIMLWNANQKELADYKTASIVIS